MQHSVKPNLGDYIDPAEVAALVRRARHEDLGELGVDVTSELLVAPTRRCRAFLAARRPGILAGLALLPAVAAEYDAAITVDPMAADGDAVAPGQQAAIVTGPLRGVLAMERVALNLVSHLSGIATLTQRYVEAVAGTRAGVYDTRKTLPGLRALQKYAVACGGGRTHRLGLFDAVLIKDNHLAHLGPDELAGAVRRAAEQARQAYPGLKFVEVEVDTLAQLDAVLGSGVDIVLLDNFEPAALREAVARRDASAPGVELEASGGLGLDTVRAAAEAGADRISVGALTHSAPALDMGLDIG